MSELTCTHTMDNEPECWCYIEAREIIEKLEDEIERLGAFQPDTWHYSMVLSVGPDGHPTVKGANPVEWSKACDKIERIWSKLCRRTFEQEDQTNE